MDTTLAAPGKSSGDPSNGPSSSFCDIVMKGGITSGVVYPALVADLSEKYTFKNIGGTSAGAIAAACAAAAEFARHHGKPDAFHDLKQLSADLGAPGFIHGLFKPTPLTWPIFNVASAMIGNAPMIARVSKAIFAAAVGFWPLTAIAVAIDALLGLWLRKTGFHDPVIWVLAVISWLVAFAGAWGLGIWWSVSRAIPNNYLGMCNGSQPKASTKPPLTDWLAAKIDEIAGTNHPLTFGDLWGMPATPQAQSQINYATLRPSVHEDSQSLAEIRGDAQVNLEMMTTCLTQGKPFRLPLVMRLFYLCPRDAHAMFPKQLAEWLLKHAAQPRSKYEAILYRALEPLVPLPVAADFPVAVAARMSLSFPLLLSAVRLYALDFRLADNIAATNSMRKLAAHETFDLDAPDAADKLADIKKQLSPKACWFSDGGLTHNFPIHFFDQPLPSWPTFAIDLDALSESVRESDKDDQSTYVWLPPDNLQGMLPNWHRIEDAKGRASVFSFLSTMLDTMQNWTDSTQAVMPGYRDRIAHIELAQAEGGLNLNMKPEVVKKLIARGRAAAALLQHAFGPSGGSAPHWLNHRWVRYRNFMALHERVLKSFHDEYSQTSTQPTYPQLVARPQGADPPGYRWKYPAQAAFAVSATTSIDQLAGNVTAQQESFTSSAPHPRGELTVRPFYD